MCLIVFAWRVIPAVPLVAAANRDEYYQRATAPAAPWPEHPQIFAGRDLQAGGSWMGIAQPAEGCKSSRFAAITNIRAPSEHRDDAPSRGRLVADFLAGCMTPQEYVDAIRAGAGAYNGFNLVLSDGDTLIWFSNRGDGDPRNGKPLEPGVYGLSNALLDAPWPKVLKTKAQFASLLCLGAPDDAYFEMLADTTPAPDQRLPDTGVPLDLERMLSAVRIESPGYGTRTSTVVKLYAEAPATLQEMLIH
ncbi:NRDE family protein [Duganella sp. BJB488]|uniref:NRDE family protein n=1 Tax=unclassified Duganella TaxID=2636909 RepID=UPI000E356052|nr:MULTISPECIES: NRDE family protein [unclassified Duganella]RFP17586.1 NRDE family protein [Duganella sp. BJB489]RFP22096.1 NRDE family protein [Duganella sp. BJB488]RFP37430.1 NRDE family protein [Duganella sp. BJB480]